MKKLLTLILAALFLTGCSQTSETPDTTQTPTEAEIQPTEADTTPEAAPETDAAVESESEESTTETEETITETEPVEEPTTEPETASVAEPETEAVPETEPSAMEEIPDLTGYWLQESYTERESYMFGTILEDTIEIYWNLSELGKVLYWAGSFTVPTASGDYSWNSSNDKTRTDASLFASGDDTKTFLYSEDTISFEASAFGESGTITLIRVSEEEYVSINESETETAVSESDSIIETVLMDESGIKITAKSLDKSGWLGPELKLLIENNTDKNLTFQANNVSVNGYMVSTSMSEDVAAGKKANGEITFMNSSLNACGIDTFADIELSLHIIDEEWNTYLDTDQISIRTAAADTYTYTYDDSGVEVYNNAGVRVVSKGLNTGDIFGQGVVFLIYNGTDETITVSDRDCSVNGFMLDPNLYADILPGKYAVDDMDFWTSDLEENSITKITDIEFVLHIIDSDTWDTIDDSEPIVLHFD